LKAHVQMLAFIILVVGGYAWFSSAVPQVRTEPPAQEDVPPGGFTMEGFAEFGRRIFEGRGNCRLCHNAVVRRAPLLLEAGADGPPVAVRASERIRDPRYKGRAENGEQYIRESLLEPSAFVVAGYGKAGTNDAVSPMPRVDEGAIGLNRVEVDAVIAYLQSASGVDITVAPPSGETHAREAQKEETAAKTVAEIAEKYGCRLCHFIPGIGMEPGEVDAGPPLDRLGRFMSGAPGGLELRDYIRRSILNPDAHVVEGYKRGIMPDDFADRMRVSELELLVNELADMSGAGG